MPDVNVLVNAHRVESVDHHRCRKWLDEAVGGPEPFALSESVMHGFLRLVTDRRLFRPPTTMDQAMEFLDLLMARPGCCVVRPGPEHFEIVRRLIILGRVTGPMVSDAAHAAVAIESGCEWITCDSDFARFVPMLRWQLL